MKTAGEMSLKEWHEWQAAILADASTRHRREAAALLERDEDYERHAAEHRALSSTASSQPFSTDAVDGYLRIDRVEIEYFLGAHSLGANATITDDDGTVHHADDGHVWLITSDGAVYGAPRPTKDLRVVADHYLTRGYLDGDCCLAFDRAHSPAPGM